VTADALLYTGEETGCLMYENEEIDQDNKDKFVCGAVAQKGDGTLLWLASPESANATGYSLSAGGNFALIDAAMDWMTNHSYKTVSIPSTLMTQNSLAIDANGVTVLAVILALVVPMAFIVPTIVYLYKRKKR
jgi:hypothetical protein